MEKSSTITTRGWRWVNKYIPLSSSKPGLLLNGTEQEVTLGEKIEVTRKLSQYPRAYCELGSGSGAHLISRALLDPQSAFFGFELRFKRAFRTAEKAEEQGLTNLMVIRNDARHAAQFFPSQSLDGIFILFPDPWDKRRWHKHRLLNCEFLSQLKKLLKPGGFISFKTDHLDYFNQAVTNLRHSGFTITKQTNDLYRSPFIENNVASEFEQLFVAKHQPVSFVEALA
jgi:tRNA (guanine-N7-)-methyltransferase